MATTDLTITETIMDSVLQRLRDAHGEELDIAYFPQDRAGYHLAHPVGAVLMGYAGSTFGAEQATDATWVERNLVLPLTLVFCQLDGPDGVIRYLDALRETLTGFTPAHCDAPLRPVSEYFITQETGIWQYGQEWATRTTSVSHVQLHAGALLQPHFEEL